MNGRIRTRTAQASDLPLLMAITVQARDRYLPGYAYVADTPPVAEARFREGDVLVAVQGEAPVGLAILKPVDTLLSWIRSRSYARIRAWGSAQR